MFVRLDAAHYAHLDRFFALLPVAGAELVGLQRVGARFAAGTADRRSYAATHRMMPSGSTTNVTRSATPPSTVMMPSSFAAWGDVHERRRQVGESG
jgi:hypothetical protein